MRRSTAMPRLRRHMRPRWLIAWVPWPEPNACSLQYEAVGRPDGKASSSPTGGSIRSLTQWLLRGLCAPARLSKPWPSIQPPWVRRHARGPRRGIVPGHRVRGASR